MIKYNFNNPYLSGLQRQQELLGLVPKADGSLNEKVPTLGSLSSLNNSLNVDSGINFNNFNQMPGMNSLNTSLNAFDPFGNQNSNSIGGAIASGNYLDPNPLINQANNNQSGSGSLDFLKEETAPEVPNYSKFGNFLATGMKGGVKTQEELQQMAIDNPEGLEQYDQDRMDQRNMALSNMLYNLGEYIKENGKPLTPNDIQQRQIRAEQMRISAEAQERFDKAYANAPDAMKAEMDLLGRDAWNELQKERFKDKNTALMRNVDSLNKVEDALQAELAKPEDQQDKDKIRRLTNNRTTYMVGIGGDEYDYDLGVKESRIKARQKQDEAFAEQNLKWNTTDRATSYNNIVNIRTAMNTLQSGANVSGLDVSLLDDFEWLQAGIFSPAANFKSDIRDVVFQSLREKLGAQFTEKEGERLVAASFNSKLSEEENYARVQRLLDASMMVYDAKQGMSDYFEDNGTLDGYRSNAPDVYEITAMVSGIPEDFKTWVEDEDTLREYASSLQDADGNYDSDAKNKLDTLKSYLNKLEREKRAEERRNKGN